MGDPGPVRRAAREVIDVGRARTTTHRHLRERLIAVFVATLGVDVICTLLAYAFEQQAKHTQVKSLGSASFWVTTQLLTVSSQLPNPISTAGRVLDVAMELYAITVIATLAGAVGTFFQRRGVEREREAAGR